MIVLANALGIVWSGHDQLAPSNYRSLLQNIGLVCRALMQKRPVVVRSLLIVATPYCQTSRTSALRVIVRRLCMLNLRASYQCGVYHSRVYESVSL